VKISLSLLRQIVTLLAADRWSIDARNRGTIRGTIHLLSPPISCQEYAPRRVPIK
jgi:hypothetical protein